MRTGEGITLREVKEVYNGAEGQLWELVMGEHIHVGGFQSSMDLAKTAGITAGMRGVDLCCCNGGGIRFLLRFCGVGRMTGVDATETVVKQAKERCVAQGLGDRVDIVHGDVLTAALPDGGFDFVWGEDAWCYVDDKSRLIKRVGGLLKAGGIVAFTDWVEGDNPMTDAEAGRLLNFMKFPSLQDVKGYSGLLAENGCEVIVARDTDRFKPCMELYLDMLNTQLTGDVLRITGFDMGVMNTLGGEMEFMKSLVDGGKLVQGMFVARKK